jgi:hypothetical protein
MNTMTQLFASRFCSPSPPPSSRRWRVVAARLADLIAALPITHLVVAN